MAKKTPPEGYSSWTDYYSHKKQVAQKYHNDGNTYTIDIPGIKDIFRYENRQSYSKQYKRELYQRMKTHKSPVPSFLNWIPGVINWLDDAQDLLYTAFYLAKPLLRRIPTRLIPYIGWAMLAMDILNLASKILGLGMTPGLSKPCVRKHAGKMKNLRKAAIESFRDFITPGGWRKKLAFILQAPQAMVNLTGYGLQLGSIMGMISESFWGTIRYLKGDKVTVRTPPPSDPATKAARFLSQSYQYSNTRDILTPDEHVGLILAHQIAIGILLEQDLYFSDQKIETLMSTQVAVFEPWELSTLEVLEEVGHPIDEDILPYTNIENPTYEHVFEEATRNHYDWEKHIRDVFSVYPPGYNAILHTIYMESAHDIIEKLTNVKFEDYTDDFDEIKIAYHVTICDFMPRPWQAEHQLQQMLEIATMYAQSRGATIPNCKDFKMACQEIFSDCIHKTKRGF